MAIDVLFLVAMLLAVFNGYRNGLIIAIFSVIGWAIGLYAATRFSDVAAGYLKEYVNPRWLAIASFVLVFILVTLLVNLGARVISKVVELALMGWLNRLGGIIFYVLLYAFIFSVLISFAEKVRLLNEGTITSSKVYPWIKPLAHITQLPFLQ